MQIKTKAINNLFLFNSLDQREVGAHAYAKALFPNRSIEDLRESLEEDLFQRLEELNTPLEKTEFFQLASVVEDPESAAHLLIDTAKVPPVFESLYLVIFELWRRLLPERQTLSIFCDELDRQIFLYQQGSMRSDEKLQKSLGKFEKILQENADLQTDKKKVRASIDEYMAHDIEEFLYEYISDQIASDLFVYAEDLLDGFYDYMYDHMWFDFLYIKILHFRDPSEAKGILRSLLKDLSIEPDLDLQIELLHFMLESSDRRSFLYLVEKTALLLKVEEDFIDLMAIVSEYYRRLDQEDLQEKIEILIENRQDRSEKEVFHHKDADFQEFVHIMDLFR